MTIQRDRHNRTLMIQIGTIRGNQQSYIITNNTAKTEVSTQVCYFEIQILISIKYSNFYQTRKSLGIDENTNVRNKNLDKQRTRRKYKDNRHDFNTKFYGKCFKYSDSTILSYKLIQQCT